MSEFAVSLLDALPEAALLSEEGRLLYLNETARHILPELNPGTPLPEALALPQSVPSGAGSFVLHGTGFSFSLSRSGNQLLLLFRSAPRQVLTGRQLEGAVTQLRAFLGELMVETHPGAPAGPALVKSCHRLFRLVNNLDYMQQAGSPEGVPFRPVTMDLAGLLRHLCRDTEALLAAAGCELELCTQLSSLLIPGDAGLLERMLLELFSNAARAAGHNRIVLTLRRQGSRAFLSVADRGGAVGAAQLAAILRQDAGSAIPRPNQGAGLGLDIVRHIVGLHGGTFLVSTGAQGPEVLISLPTGPLSPRVSVQTPGPITDGGLSPLLVALSDALPASVFDPEEFD